MQAQPPDLLLPMIFGVWGLILIVGLAATVFWIIELVDVVQRQFPDPSAKVIWVLVIVFLHGLGAVIYYFVGRSQGYIPGRSQQGPWYPPGPQQFPRM